MTLGNRISFSLLICFLLSACTHEGERGDYAGGDAGHLVASLTRTPGMNMILYGFSFHNKATGEKDSFWWNPDNDFEGRKPEIREGNKEGLVEIHKLPPGEYILDNFGIDDGGLSWSAIKDFDVPFTIEPNKTTYLGEFEAVVVTRKNFLGVTRPDHFYFVPSDHKDRDMAIANRITPNLGSVIDQAPSAKAFNSPLVRERVDEKMTADGK